MSSAEPVRALVSIHDVMPQTQGQVEQLIRTLEREAIRAITLLVVPGSGWSASGIAWLRDLEGRGYRLAGHGWRHRIDHYGGFRHRVHAAFISRQVAEHLALDAPGILELMMRCYDWFLEHDLTPPTLYVPPAWALGRIERSALAELPFLQYELFSGILSGDTGRFQPVPLLGYEADTLLRAPVLRLWNQVNRRRATTYGWLRIGIHPHDLQLHLARDLQQDLRRFQIRADYEALSEADLQVNRLLTSAKSPAAADSTISRTRSKPS